MKPNGPDAYSVWQRVHPAEHREPQTLQILLYQLNRDRAFLIKQLHHEDRPLIREFTDQMHCLSGILLLSGGRLPRHTSASLKDHSLKQCYDHALQRLAAYQLRTSDPVYGPVFRDLAGQTEYHCRSILQLMGAQLTLSKEKGR